MAAPVQQALSFLAGLRSRRYRVARLALLASVLLAQALLVVHSLDHNRAEHGVPCVLCAAADHAAPPSHETTVAIAPLQPDSVVASTRAPVVALVILRYRSRAPPPEHLRA